MSVPSVPPTLEQFGPRPFSFHPAILNLAHNRWVYRKSNWSEILVLNTKTHEEVWVPRRFLGVVSLVDEAVMVVGLLKQLEYQAGLLRPVERRVIEMPHAVERAVNDIPRPFSRPAAPRVGPAPVVAISLGSGAESRVGKTALAGTALAIAGCVLMVSFYRGGVLGGRMVYAPVFRTDLGLDAQAGYDDIVRVLGEPSNDRRADSYRILGYPHRGLYVVLMGQDMEHARYIGALDRNRRVVQTVQIPGHGDSLAYLRALKTF